MSIDFSSLSDEEIAGLETPGTESPALAPDTNAEDAPEERTHINPEDDIEDASSRGDGTLESVVQLPGSSEEDGAADPSDDDHTTPNQTDEEGHASPGAVAPAEGDSKGANGDEGDPPSSSSPENEGKKDDKPEAGSPDGETDYKAAYDQIMAPFKANGREIKLESPEEAVRLMQMGANYTKKMQTLQPNLRMMRMLEKNDLLSEDQIGFLIDLHKKDPGAIQKLLKDSNIDPLDLDKDDTATYKPGDHKVSDSEIAFTSTVEELQSSETGRELINDINSNWDLQSRQHLAKEPELLRIFSQQRDNGLYQQITDEMTRQRALGNLDHTVPFLTAYKRVGDALAEQGKLGGSAPGSNPAPAAPQQQPTAPMETRPAAPKKAASKNGDAARAASPAPKSAVPAAPPINPYEMSDEEIASLRSFKV